MSADNGQPFGIAISPSWIVGIVILSAFVIIILAASTFRFYRRGNRGSSNPDNYETPLNDLGDIDLFNPNQVRSAGQDARMKEVRWINKMYAWERGRQARLEIGELRPTTMFAGSRKGKMKNWDEWSVWENREVSNCYEEPLYPAIVYAD